MTAMRTNGWGDPSQATVLPDSVRQLLAQLLSLPSAGAKPVAVDQIQVPASMLPLDVLERLGDITEVKVDDADRVRHTRGKSTVDLLRIRRGDVADAPDAVVRPGTHDEVLAVLDVCGANQVAVVPFGGGTSVVGGLAPAREGFAGVVALDLSRLNRLTTVDAVSGVATLEAGVTGPRAERLLGEHGLTLGHYPQSFEFATIGGFAATRSSGQFSLGYGRFDEMVVGLRVATPTGTVTLGRAPRSAAGPDLRQLFLGSEGTLGVITEVTVAVQPVPPTREREAWRFDSFDAGLVALRRLVQRGPRPTMARLSDETETAVNATVEGRSGASGCQLMVAYEDAQALRDRDGVRAVLAALGGSIMDNEVSADWAATRFRAPYLRDALLDEGVLVETLETATFWSGLPALRAAVTGALTSTLSAAGTPPIVLCHVSHAYPTGGALYLTVVCAQNDDPVAQWTAAKQAATRAILDAGGTVTHHHAVGRDHADGLAEEVGPLAIDALRAVKARLDPAGILNPGVLFSP
jgi:alkyldihydroxyacetonephosphate synthase